MKILGTDNIKSGNAILIGASWAPIKTGLYPFGSERKVRKAKRIE